MSLSTTTQSTNTQRSPPVLVDAAVNTQQPAPNDMVQPSISGRDVHADLRADMELARQLQQEEDVVTGYYTYEREQNKRIKLESQLVQPPGVNGQRGRTSPNSRDEHLYDVHANGAGSAPSQWRREPLLANPSRPYHQYPPDSPPPYSASHSASQLSNIERESTLESNSSSTRTKKRKLNVLQLDECSPEMEALNELHARILGTGGHGPSTKAMRAELNKLIDGSLSTKAKKAYRKACKEIEQAAFTPPAFLESTEDEGPESLLLISKAGTGGKVSTTLEEDVLPKNDGGSHIDAWTGSSDGSWKGGHGGCGISYEIESRQGLESAGRAARDWRGSACALGRLPGPNEAEARGVKLILQRTKDEELYGDKVVVIVQTDSQDAIRKVKKAFSEQHTGDPAIYDITYLIGTLNSLGIEVRLVWLKGHHVCAGNRVADMLAGYGRERSLEGASPGTQYDAPGQAASQTEMRQAAAAADAKRRQLARKNAAKSSTLTAAVGPEVHGVSKTKTKIVTQNTQGEFFKALAPTSLGPIGPLKGKDTSSASGTSRPKQRLLPQPFSANAASPRVLGNVSNNGESGDLAKSASYGYPPGGFMFGHPSVSGEQFTFTVPGGPATFGSEAYEGETRSGALQKAKQKQEEEQKAPRPSSRAMHQRPARVTGPESMPAIPMFGSCLPKASDGSGGPRMTAPSPALKGSQLDPILISDASDTDDTNQYTFSGKDRAHDSTSQVLHGSQSLSGWEAVARDGHSAAQTGKDLERQNTPVLKKSEGREANGNASIPRAPAIATTKGPATSMLEMSLSDSDEEENQALKDQKGTKRGHEASFADMPGMKAQKVARGKRTR